MKNNKWYRKPELLGMKRDALVQRKRRKENQKKILEEIMEELKEMMKNERRQVHQTQKIRKKAQRS